MEKDNCTIEKVVEVIARSTIKRLNDAQKGPYERYDICMLENVNHSITGLSSQEERKPSDIKFTEDTANISSIINDPSQEKSVECNKLSTLNFSCGHTLQVQCSKIRKQRFSSSSSATSQNSPCGHTVIFNSYCLEKCETRLQCGHRCHLFCGEGEWHSHERWGCTASCPKQLLCGHYCTYGCAEPEGHTERCMKQCEIKCSHGVPCGKKCYLDCEKCISTCPYQCSHYKCSKMCFEICDRPPCYEPCELKLPCSHLCFGLCGEPCPPCRICFSDIECSISLSKLSEFDSNDRVYILPDYNCVFSVEALDIYFKNKAKNGQHTSVKLWVCPSCQTLIYGAHRYNKYIKTELEILRNIKLQLDKRRAKLALSENEIASILNVMNEETLQNDFGYVSGRWFVCQNQHPYYIGDCGRATEIFNCPECNAPIGGEEHKLLKSNNFFSELNDFI